MNNRKYWLSKRSNGIYRVGYFIDSKLHWKTTGKKTKAEALSVLKDFEQAFIKPAPAHSLSAFKAEILNYLTQCSQPGTVAIYKGALTNFIEIIGDMDIKNVSARDADRYKSTRVQCFRKGSKTKKVKPITVNSEIRALKASFATALKWGLIKTNPFAPITQYHIPEAAPVYFKREDFQTFINAIKEDWLRHIVVFGALTGMRRGEIINLRADNVDLQRKVVYLESSATFQMKAGRRRIVPLSESACFLLSQLPSNRKSGYVFENNGRQIGKYWLTHRFKKYVRAQFHSESALHFHSLRHTTASWLVQSGSSLYEVQCLLGHTSSKTTQVYAHLQPQELHGTVNRIQISMN